MKLPRTLMDLVRGGTCAGLVLASACQSGAGEAPGKSAATLAPVATPSPPGLALSGAVGGSLFEHDPGTPLAPSGSPPADAGDAAVPGIGSPPDVDAGVAEVDAGRPRRHPRRPQHPPDYCPGCGMG